MHRRTATFATRPAANALLVAASLVVAVALSGCDTFSNLTVNCQVGIKNDGDPISGCNFQNTGKAEASGCVKVHVVGAEAEAEGGEPRTFVSDKICSGTVGPGAVTEPIPLTFAAIDPRVVADACVDGEGDSQQFHCAFKVEEVGNDD